MVTETKEGQTTTTWSMQSQKREEVPDTDTGEKTGAIGHLRGPSVATLRLTQVGETTNTHTFFCIIDHLTGTVEDISTI